MSNMATQSSSACTSVPHAFPRAQRELLIISYLHFLLFSSVRWYTVTTNKNFIVFILIARKYGKIWYFASGSVLTFLFFFYIVKFSSSDDAWNIFSSKDIPFSQQIDHFLRSFLDNSEICELFIGVCFKSLHSMKLCTLPHIFFVSNQMISLSLILCIEFNPPPRVKQRNVCPVLRSTEWCNTLTFVLYVNSDLF